MSAARPAWWRSAVVYQLYPRSFRDTTGNGVGDLRGVIEGLDHLSWLGVDALWLSPVNPSPMVDHGYDVSDYCDVDPLFGSLADMDELVREAHRRGIKVLLDWVPNHTSDQHPWFLASRSARGDPKRDWYHWRDGTPDVPPINWTRAFPFGAPAWSFDAATGAWFLHLFSPQQPDLNWANPEVRSAMHATLEFWLDRGVDGFRMDVIHCIGKDPVFPNLSAERAALPAMLFVDEPATHAYLREIRRLLDAYDGDRVAVGEVYLLDTERVASYYGDAFAERGELSELDLAFNFPPLLGPWEADAWRGFVEATERHIGGEGRWPTWVLSNHDNPRHRTRYGGDERVARAAAVLLLTLRGTPFLYAGEELGLEDAIVPKEQIVDAAGGHRDGCRAPIPWTNARGHGWASARTWLPFPPDSACRNVESLRDDGRSILQLYRELIRLRRESPALRSGSLTLLEAARGVLGWQRDRDGDERIVLVNFAADGASADAWQGMTLELSSDPARATGARFDGRLMAREAVILRRSSRTVGD